MRNIIWTSYPRFKGNIGALHCPYDLCPCRKRHLCMLHNMFTCHPRALRVLARFYGADHLSSLAPVVHCGELVIMFTAQEQERGVTTSTRLLAPDTLTQMNAPCQGRASSETSSGNLQTEVIYRLFCFFGSYSYWLKLCFFQGRNPHGTFYLQRVYSLIIFYNDSSSIEVASSIRQHFWRCNRAYTLMSSSLSRPSLLS